MAPMPRPLTEQGALNTQQQNDTVAAPLDKTYFDDPSLSDLTIKLSDRSVHVHRIVLCRGSKYFEKLITGQFQVPMPSIRRSYCLAHSLTARSQESNSKITELQDDDPEAMIALLRFLYGLPYGPDAIEWHDGRSLLPHVLVYTAAEKYQVEELQARCFATIESNLRNNNKNMLNGDDPSDFLDALREMFVGTPSEDNEGRRLFVMHCAEHLRQYARNEAFMTLVAQIPELGAELIGGWFRHGEPGEGNFGMYGSPCYTCGQWKKDSDGLCENCEEF